MKLAARHHGIDGHKRFKLIPLTLLATLVSFSFPAFAQQSTKIPRIAYVATTGQGNAARTFQQALRDLGYVEGKNILIEYRYLAGNLDRAANVVDELIRLNVDVLVVSPSPAIVAAKQATKTIPIVIVISGDPVAAGLVDSLAHPGGNVTGVTRLVRDLSGKRLELLKEIVPTISRVGVLLDGDYPDLRAAFKEYEAAARPLKIQLHSLEIQSPNGDSEAAFREAVNKRMSALLVVRGGVVNRYRKQIADLAVKNRLPSMFEGSNDVERGGLLSYSANEAESYTRAAWYVDKILRGAKPADLPVEQPTKFELVINLKTAKQIGVTIPPQVLARADRAIR